MKSIKALFKIEMADVAEAYNTARLSENKSYLRKILIAFGVLQFVMVFLHIVQSGRVNESELLFFIVCFFLTGAIGFVSMMGKEFYFRVSLFLTMFLATIYSWYGSIIEFGEETFLIVLITTALFIVDAEGYRFSSMISGLVYMYAVITQQKHFIPDGRFLALITLLAVLWYYTEHKHKREINIYNKNRAYKEQHDQLELEIEYRDTLTDRLMESEHKFRVFMNHVPAALIVLDEGLIKYANKSTLQLTGYSRDELENIDWIDLIDYEDAILLENKNVQDGLGAW